jgi:hypothetical protein
LCTDPPSILDMMPALQPLNWQRFDSLVVDREGISRHKYKSKWLYRPSLDAGNTPLLSLSQMASFRSGAGSRRHLTNNACI